MKKEDLPYGRVNDLAHDDTSIACSSVKDLGLCDEPSSLQPLGILRDERAKEGFLVESELDRVQVGSVGVRRGGGEPRHCCSCS